MLQKEINEIRRHLTGERCCISKLYGCFVNQQKERERFVEKVLL